MQFYLVIRTMEGLINKVPILKTLASHIYRSIKRNPAKPKPYPGSAKFWEERYARGGNSGVGSYGKFAEFKAEVINNFVAERAVESVIEFGCGDGNQLRLANYRCYLGFDVSKTAVTLCKEIFASDKSKVFRLMWEYSGEKADLALSLDVIYHLVEDEVFENYMRMLFGASNRYVIIYSSDSDNNAGHGDAHIRHRKFTLWIQENHPSWKLIQHIPNKYPFKGDHRTGSFADFFIYEKT